MGDFHIRVRRFIEDRLPWFDPKVERVRNARTERIRKRSIATRVRAERIIEEYRVGSLGRDAAGERVIDEVRRGDDE